MSLGCSSPEDVTKAIANEGVQFIDVKFTDLFGQWQHFTLPTEQYDEEGVFGEGLGFDGSSIRGFQAIEKSDMVLKGDPTTAILDPAMKHTTLSMIFQVYDPVEHTAYSRDPRNVAHKAIEYMKSTGIADTMYVGPEAEFFIFDDVSYVSARDRAGYAVDSDEAIWAAEEPGLGHKIDHLSGYFPVPPYDGNQDLRSAMVRGLIDAGIHVEVHHHEVATAGQAEIDMHFGPMLQMSDHIQLYKYVIKNVAKAHGKTVTFMPKPLFEDNGSGMHTHQSLWKDGEPLFAGDSYAGLSDLAMAYAGGLVKHMNAILAFAAPLTNSYKRLVPGYEAPVIKAISARNRSAALRIPMYSESPKAKRIEFRCPDPGANPYLAFSAMLMAGLDGIKNNLDPGEPHEEDLFDADALGKYEMVKGSLGEVLDELEADSDFLLEGGVFTDDLLEAYISYKREEEIDQVRLRPHPHEFTMYYGI
ncbi:MAG: type I glutamate--ammonia ligase [Thermoleophilia bacterium]|nr:type I glutamate--ammonia ligase [Thermoleophilia bacterium]